MKNAATRSGLVLVVTLINGCATLTNTLVMSPDNLDPPLEIYGGVRSDLRVVANQITLPYPPREFLDRNAYAALSLMDVPLSLIGDTLTLGKTVPATIERRSLPVESQCSGPATYIDSLSRRDDGDPVLQSAAHSETTSSRFQ